MKVDRSFLVVSTRISKGYQQLAPATVHRKIGSMVGTYLQIFPIRNSFVRYIDNVVKNMKLIELN